MLGSSQESENTTQCCNTRVTVLHAEASIGFLDKPTLRVDTSVPHERLRRSFYSTVNTTTEYVWPYLSLICPQASETLFRMGVNRKWLRPIQYGEVAMFACSSALLLYLYRGTHNEKDSIYSLLR